jgi:hypothetical protein
LTTETSIEVLVEYDRAAADAKSAAPQAPRARDRLTNIKALADMIAHDTIPEDGKYRSNTQYRRLWRIARDAALSAFEYAALQASSAGEADA